MRKLSEDLTAYPEKQKKYLEKEGEAAHEKRESVSTAKMRKTPILLLSITR
ncbi:hypothetical protein [Chryseobacterium indoltheticum]|uniref:hypothetical protein n=1 Tax=Chryseobacterium indoltheticum TaxID=254 RepID=UPI003F4991C0